MMNIMEVVMKRFLKCILKAIDEHVVRVAITFFTCPL